MSFQDDVKKAAQELTAVELAISDGLPKATKIGAQMLVDEMKRRVAKRSGATARDLTVEEELVNDAGAVYSAGPTAKRAFVAKFLEYGVGPVRGKLMRMVNLDEFTRRVGARRKRPFMRPAADAKEMEIGRTIGNYINIRVKRAQR